MKKSLVSLPLFGLALGLAACSGGQQNDTAVNDTAVVNAEESLGNDVALPSENVSDANLTEAEPANAFDNSLGNAG